MRINESRARSLSEANSRKGHKPEEKSPMCLKKIAGKEERVPCGQHDRFSRMSVLQYPTKNCIAPGMRGTYAACCCRPRKPGQKQFQSGLASPNHKANLSGLVLCCIEAVFVCKHSGCSIFQNLQKLAKFCTAPNP